MPSSTSSFRPSDTPPTYQRELPSMRLGRAWVIALVLALLGLLAWEMKWRAFGAAPSYANSDGAWAVQRRRIAQGEGGKTVLIGSSRVLFDVQLPIWERAMGERPIQLSFEGTSPIFALEDLASDPNFTGRLLVGISPPLFFSGFDRRASAIKNWKRETLSQRASHWLSVHWVEPLFSFFDPDYALMVVLKRQDWPPRNGVPIFQDVRRLSVQEIDRNTQLWEKVEKDPAYQALCQNIWRQFFAPPPGVTPEMARQNAERQLERAVAAVEKLRGRGVEVIFLRAPSGGEFLAAETKGFPRQQTWDVLLKRTGAPGIHFEDYPALQNYTLPEWSHMTASEAARFTAALCEILQRDFGWSSAPTKGRDQESAAP